MSGSDVALTRAPMCFDDGETAMNSFDYKGYRIYPSARLNAETGRWKPRITFEINNIFKTYTHDEECNTPSEAIFNCVRIGEHMIDEGIDMNGPG